MLTSNIIEYFEVNEKTRMITVPNNLTLGVQEDHNVERVYFRVKKNVGDDINLARHQIYVKYVVFSEKGYQNLPNPPYMYYCDDVIDNGDNITFSWKLSASVFKTPGLIAFSLVASDGQITRWNTQPAIGTVLETIPGGIEEVAQRYPDVITQLLNRMTEVEKTTGAVLEEAKTAVSAANRAASKAEQASKTAMDSATKATEAMNATNKALEKAGTLVDTVTGVSYKLGIENGGLYIEEVIK